MAGAPSRFPRRVRLSPARFHVACGCAAADTGRESLESMISPDNSRGARRRLVSPGRLRTQPSASSTSHRDAHRRSRRRSRPQRLPRRTDCHAATRAGGVRRTADNHPSLPTALRTS
jgi:hypothetical protein